ncbi:MAG: anti-sigma factor domain-containing protein [Gaiellaceae bacterium]
MDDGAHLDLGGYLLGALEPAEREAYERHLEGCPECREELRELGDLAPLLEVAFAAEAAEPPPELRVRTLAALEREGGTDELDGRVEAAPEQARAERRWWLRRGAAFALATGLAATAAFFVGRTYESRDPGPVEVRAALSAPDNPAIGASARVVKTGIGRVIEFRSDELPILPTGEFYELWFVGPGDTLAKPNRISAGTFHPDEQGRSHVTFAAAVDPAKYPVLSVTAEPGDGDPRRTGAEVLRS